MPLCGIDIEREMYIEIVYLALKNYLMNKEPLESLQIVS